MDSAIADYRAAESLYRGDYLEEDRYEDWAAATRQQFREMRHHLLKQLAGCYSELEQYEEALNCYQKILAQEPYRESIWRNVMLCYYRLGERGQALLAFEQCREILAKEFGIMPMPETLKLKQSMLKTTFWSEQIAEI